jgi:hypothetical protein
MAEHACIHRMNMTAAATSKEIIDLNFYGLFDHDYLHF